MLVFYWTGQKEIAFESGPPLTVRCKVRYLSFSAHADSSGIQSLSRHVKPKNMLLVHGEKEGMMKLAQVLNRDLGINVYTPATGQTVQIPVEPKDAAVNAYIHYGCFCESFVNNSNPLQKCDNATLDLDNDLDPEVKFFT